MIALRNVLRLMIAATASAFVAMIFVMPQLHPARAVPQLTMSLATPSDVARLKRWTSAPAMTETCLLSDVAALGGQCVWEGH
jgi:hypothetical protein